MKTLRVLVALAGCLLLISPVIGADKTLAAKKTALDDYIAKRDTTYSWKLVKTIPGDGVTTFVLDLKSQSWGTPARVDRSRMCRPRRG